MASDTAPAAVPGPENAPQSTAPAAPTHSGTQQPGGLAGLLAAVEPTRPPAGFTLNPTTGEGAASGQQEVHGTSADFQNGDPTQAAGGKQQSTAGGSGNGRQETSVVRAWLLAGAERWKKGADARNKRLDIQKARAQALQVKETRTVSVNRSSGASSGKPSGGTGGKSDGGKSLSSKSGGGSPKGSKNASGPQSKGPQSAGAGGSGGAGRGGKESGSQPGAGRAKGPGGSDGQGGRGRGGGGKPSSGDGKDHSSRRVPHNSAGASKDKPGGQTTSPSHSKTSGSSGSASAGSGTGPGKGKKPDGGTGKPQTTETCGDGSGISTAKGKTTKSGAGPANGSDGTKTSTDGRDGTKPAGKQDQPGKGSGRTDPAGKGGPAAGTSGDTDPTKNSTRTGKDGTPAPTGKPKLDTQKPGQPAGQTKPDTDPTTAKDPKKPRPATGTGGAPGTSPGRAPGSGIDLKASREAGYRDGTRAATVTAHVEAWRDGVRDGYRDKKEDATREKQRLDQAHDQYKARPQPDKDQPVTVPASSADYQPPVPPKPDHVPGPQPIQVTGTDATHIHLAGGDRPHIKHGEVRTLRRFQQTLEAKNDRMTQVAEATRTLEAHAREQAKQITELLEQARGSEGGDKLVTALTRLAETADVQTGKAAEVHKRGIRAAEACKTLSSNTETRYGGIYKAVVDSPDGAAKMSYYQEMSHA